MQTFSKTDEATVKFYRGDFAKQTRLHAIMGVPAEEPLETFMFAFQHGDAFDPATDCWFVLGWRRAAVVSWGYASNAFGNTEAPAPADEGIRLGLSAVVSREEEVVPYLSAVPAQSLVVLARVVVGFVRTVMDTIPLSAQMERICKYMTRERKGRKRWAKWLEEDLRDYFLWSVNDTLKDRTLFRWLILAPGAEMDVPVERTKTLSGLPTAECSGYEFTQDLDALFGKDPIVPRWEVQLLRNKSAEERLFLVRLGSDGLADRACDIDPMAPGMPSFGDEWDLSRGECPQPSGRPVAAMFEEGVRKSYQLLMQEVYVVTGTDFDGWRHFLRVENDSGEEVSIDIRRAICVFRE